MRPYLLAATLICTSFMPAAAQTRSAPPFSFDTCYNRCLQLGSSPASCSGGCSNRAATLARIPPGAPRSGNDDPRSPRYHDPEPRPPAW